MTASSSNKQTKPGRSLHFGVMCSGDKLQAWQAESIRLLMDAGHLCKLQVVDANIIPEKSFSQKLGGYFSKTGLYHVYQRFFFRPKAKAPVSFASLIDLDEIESINCQTTKKKYSEYFSDEDIKIIKSRQLDFILRFGFNIIRGDILDAAKYGVWSFHHGDEQKYRGGPPGFWEIVKKDPVTGAILQRLTDKLDGGIILKKGFFKTLDHSYEGQIDQLYFASAAWPTQVCKDIVNGVINIADKQESKTKAKIFRAPKNLQMLSFWIRILKKKFHFHSQELFMPEDWNVGISAANINWFVDHFGKNQLLWLPKAPKGHYYADPFGLMIGEYLHIVFEDYDYKSRKGIISNIIFSNGNFGKASPAITEDFHLSYPYVFEANGEYYCVPESADAKQVRLYKYNPIEDRFDFVKLLLDNFPGVDPTVFHYKDKWWLFATHKAQSNTNLHAFVSDNFDGPYSPHMNNPIKTDIRSARPAGRLYVENGELIRPAQDCSLTYGGRIALNKIVKLTETEFREETIKLIGPVKNSKYDKGFHTLACSGDYTIFDGKRFKFNKNNFWYKLKTKLGRE
jgi:hypothetical protein